MIQYILIQGVSIQQKYQSGSQLGIVPTTIRNIIAIKIILIFISRLE